MNIQQDLKILKDLPLLKIWGENLDKIQEFKEYKGKFLIIDHEKLIAKLYPKKDYDQSGLYHNHLIEELGIEDSQAPEIMAIVRGGKIRIEYFETHVECELSDKSSIYGRYNKEDIDIKKLEQEIQKIFNLKDIPVSITLS